MLRILQLSSFLYRESVIAYLLVYLGVSWFLLAILYNYYKYKDITLAVLETQEYSYFFNFKI